MANLFSIKKAVDFSGILWFKALKIGLMFCAIAFVIWSIWVAVIKPHTKFRTTTETTTQQADEIKNYRYNYYKPNLAFGIGIELWGFKLGLYKEVREDKIIERTIPKK